MAQVASAIPNLFNGISQQADTLRLPTQGEEQMNMYPSLIQGLVKRPPLEYIGGFTSTFSESPMKGTLHVADRGGDATNRSRFLLYVTPEGIHAYSPNGVNKPLHYEVGAKAYLSRDGNTGSYEIVTVADYTFIVNPNVEVKMRDDEIAPDYMGIGLVNIRQASYETDYTIMLKLTAGSGSTQTQQEVTITYSTPSSMGTVDNPPPKISTIEIASKLAEKIASDPNLSAAARAVGSVVFIEPHSGCFIKKLETKDSRGDTHINAVYRTVKRLSDLPAEAENGMIVKITGSDTTRFNDYYVRYEQDSEVLEGVWRECPKPGVRTSLDPATMPHVLVDNGTHFMFQPLTTWGKRQAGDEETAPEPEFVGQTITGVFQYRNRLGLLSQDVVALSEASEFFNFFPTTVVTSLDSDPIFVSASLDGAPNLKHAVPFNEEIILFADRAQFKLAATEVLSPTTAAVNSLTHYPVNTAIKPVNSGKNIFFVNAPPGSSARVYEYYLDVDTGTKTAMDITAHVPQFIDQGVTGMTCSPGLSLMCLYRHGAPDLWMYKYYWSEQDKLQAAWFRCHTGDNRKVYGAVFLEDTLYLLLRINEMENTLYLCKMDFSKTLLGAEAISSTPEKDAGFAPFLDLLSEVALDGVYNHDTGETVVTLQEPYNRFFKADRLTFLDKSTRTEVRPFHVEEAQHRFTFYGDVRGKAVMLGEKYPAFYTFTRAFVRDKNRDGGSGQLSVHVGRLQLQKWRLILGPTGYLEALVHHADGREFRYPWNPPHLASRASHLGKPSVPEAAVMDFPVRANAAEVKVTIRNDSWLPSSVISAEWEGNFTTKGRQRV